MYVLFECGEEEEEEEEEEVQVQVSDIGTDGTTRAIMTATRLPYHYDRGDVTANGQVRS